MFNSIVPTSCGTAPTTFSLEYAADYSPYGRLLRSYTASGARERFLTTGHERDPETGYDNRGARLYDAEIGRFLTVDPLAAKYTGWSTYCYVLGNPVKFVDPTGRSAQSTHIDGQGNVLAVYNDGDLGVYKHNHENVQKWRNGESGAYLQNKGEGIQQISETSTWDRYLDNVVMGDGHRLPGTEILAEGNNPSITNTAIELSAGGAIGGGFGVGIGVVWDDSGQSALYLTIKGKLGFGAGGGVDVSHIAPTSCWGFKLDDWEGYGTNYNFGAGLFSGSYGGNVTEDQRGSQQFYDFGSTYDTFGGSLAHPGIDLGKTLAIPKVQIGGGVDLTSTRILKRF